MENLTVVEIENEQYVIASQVIVKENIFVYLVNLNDNSKVMFAKLDDDKTLTKVEDGNVIDELVPYFLKNQNIINLEQ